MVFCSSKTFQIVYGPWYISEPKGIPQTINERISQANPDEIPEDINEGILQRSHEGISTGTPEGVQGEFP